MHSIMQIGISHNGIGTYAGDPNDIRTSSGFAGAYLQIDLLTR